MEVPLFILLAVVGGCIGLKAGKDYRNQTVECSFVQMNACFGMIAALGGNFTARYAENPVEMNRTCQSKGNFLVCIQSVPQACNAVTHETVGKMRTIGNLVDKLCSNGTDSYAFMNSSRCYNNRLFVRKGCEIKSALNGTDAKSLCCKSRKMQDCLEKEMPLVCPRNASSYQDHIVNVYSVYTNTLCAPYFKHCNGVPTNALSLACVLLMAKFTLLNVQRVLVF